MNIREAKEQVKNAMIAYFTKDGDGEYKMPIEKQRPVFLMGPPGIGKTAIMEQIASEMGVGLLSYSMTHHTRQSALGLPFIEHKVYQGESYDISEYTMSEIIASIYDLMEETGVKEGILFLDEINCVSETLAPIMLQFLQYKIFGRHRVPDGWIVVTAGNPPEYNNSVREFDIVTWDRLKRIDVEPDYEAWKAYAYEKHVHPAIVTYLEIKKADFYRIETTVDGKKFVTARGWDDLSQMMYLYEENHLPVDELLISQYLQNPRIAKNFAVYYDLYQKYQSDYQVDEILAGTVGDEITLRAKEAKFDERLSLLGMLLDALSGKSKTVIEKDLAANELVGLLREYKMMVARTEKSPGEWLEEMIERQRENIAQGAKAGSLSREGIVRMKRVVKLLEQGSPKVEKALDGKEAFLVLKELLEESRAANKAEASSVKANFEAVFS
nr:AAA family ATPase [Lachnospiraceae bacterium]